MRFFKYLVFMFFVSVNTFAYWEPYGPGEGSYYNYAQHDTWDALCSANMHLYTNRGGSTYTKYNNSAGTNPRCNYQKENGTNLGGFAVREVEKPIKCPAKDTPIYSYFNAGSPIPTQTCSQNADGTFCKNVAKGDPMILNHENNRQSVLLFSASETPSTSCTPLFDNQCDKTDPYGACFQPPDDGCTRQADGSIICPDDTPPPQPDNTCNGATYCKRPPEGCGEGYVSGSFNGELLCVKSGPSNPQEPKPDDPTDPDNCKNGGSYCEAPPNDEACPAGYYESTYNGSKICVKNSPNPNDPNPNDPNNNDPNNPPDPNDPNNPSPIDGFDDSGIINAIKALRDSLLGAIGGVSGKLTTLINGQKDTNKHLDDIKKESIKGNEKLDKVNENLTGTNSKLDTANDHLKDISDHSRAASEAIGESNKKLDGIKDAVDAFGKCKNESYNPNDPDSNKYRECTEEDAKNGLGGEVSTPFKELDLGAISSDLFKVNAECPAPIPLYLPVVKHTFHIDLAGLCQVLHVIGLFIAIAAMIHGIAILVENS
ncbi:hypothetical protein [Acinetobacter haemolyticus]|uniref:hypothetical protein n=1 Tax=Acinetobacter haemolyticus TaxID=29430 RepID=UPI000E1A3442|nr:hypothetical protein [Acinetobacter haemolyticus]SUU20051.1 Uncharacterised protein [Acinetobacter haemolyticus]